MPKRAKPEEYLASTEITDLAAARALVAEGQCPFCGRGPFAVVAMHVAQVHGLPVREFRDKLEVTYGAMICDPGHSAAARRRSRARLTPELLAKMLAGQSGGQRELSVAAKRLNAEKLRQARAGGGWRAGAEASRRKGEGTARQVASEWASGLTLGEVAKKLNLTVAGVREAMDRADVDRTGAKSRAQRLRWEQTPGLQTALVDGWKAKSKAQVDRLRVRWEHLGSDYAAALALAVEEGMRPRTLIDRLRRNGVQVPDGRTA